MKALNEIQVPYPVMGGKARLARQLLPLFPVSFRTYVEGFGGSGALLFAKPPSSLEIFNDLDDGIAEFFRVLRDPAQFRYLQYKLALMPYSRAEYEFCAHHWCRATCPVERAARWFYVARTSFGGRWGEGWGAGRTPDNVRKWTSAVEGLAEFHARLREVQVERLDFRQLLDTYDSPDTFFFLDPPYVPETRQPRIYRREMTYNDHVELVERLPYLRGKVLLCGYRHPLYDRLSWPHRTFDRHCATSGAGRERQEEVVWTNYNPEVWGE